MKYLSVRNWLFAAPALMLLLGLGGCVSDKSDPDYTPEAGTGELTITVSVPATQAPAVSRSIAGAGGEAAVKSIDVLVFRPGAVGNPDILVQHARGENIDPSEGTDANNYLVKFKAKLVKNAAASRVVVIANAAAAVSGVMDTATPGVTTKTDILAALQFANAAKWNAGASTYMPIPMYGEKALPAGGVTYGMKIDGVEMTRMLARVDVINGAANFTLSDIYLVNRNTNGYITPAWNATTGALLIPSDAAYPYTRNLNPVLPSAPGTAPGDAAKLTYTYAHNGGAGYLGEIYTFEAPKSTGAEGTSGHTDAACLIVRGTMSGDATPYYYRIDFTAGVDAAGVAPGAAGFNPSTVAYMPVWRNHRYTFTIGAVRGKGYASFADALKSLGVMNNLQTTLHVVDESAINNTVFNGQHYLGLGDDVTLGYALGAAAQALCITNYSYGWQIAGIEYVNGTGWLSASKEGGAAADKSANINVEALSKNGSGESRVAYVRVVAGRLTHRLKVTQVSDPPEVPVVPGTGTLIGTNESYMGAFWRADQRGERLIRIPVTATGVGKWAVQVYDYGADFAEGDILFSTSKTTDTGCPWSANYSGTETHSDPDYGAAKRYVTDGDTYALGTVPAVGDCIEFRIGLKQTFTPTAAKPARYAVIVISYFNNTRFQKMYLRQGERADYIMAPGDLDATGAAFDATIGRPDARKWSPYNLTATGMSDAVDFVQIRRRPAYDGEDVSATGTGEPAFTDYPTQAGALFQGGPNNTAWQRTAIHPTKATISGWVGSARIWDDNLHECCPQGYSRVRVGLSTDGMEGNEAWQSLASTKSSFGNSVWGYYADGFFDRKTIINRRVAGDTKDVSYGGCLIYNPVGNSVQYNASTFIPASGIRNGAGGSVNASTRICIYGKQTVNSGYGWIEADINNPAFRMTDYGGNVWGMSVRCVVDPDYVAP